jgi:hypothetical protein
MIFDEWMALSPSPHGRSTLRAWFGRRVHLMCAPSGAPLFAAYHPRLVDIRRIRVVQGTIFLRIAGRRLHRIGVRLRIFDRRRVGLGGPRLRIWLLRHIPKQRVRLLCSGAGREGTRKPAHAVNQNTDEPGARNAPSSHLRHTITKSPNVGSSVFGRKRSLSFRVAYP